MPPWTVGRGVFDGLDLFAMEPRVMLAALERRSGGARTEYGMVAFETLGIIAADVFHDQPPVYVRPDLDEQDDRKIAVFTRESQATLLQDALPVSYL